jgi:cAMP-dependent protein kinase regulator
MSSERHRHYIQTKVNPVLEDLVKDVARSDPADIPAFIVRWLKHKFHISELSASEQEELRQLRLQVAKHRNISTASGSEDSQDDEEDMIDELPITIDLQAQKPRSSVTAEAYGHYNRKESFQPRVIPKSQSQRERITDRLSHAFMFAALDQSERDIVILAMEERSFAVGETVITQGEEGNELFVVDSGKLECFKQVSGSAGPKLVKTYGPGDAFGELALLYNAPRAATIKVISPCVLWVLDRNCFNHIVKESAIRKRERYESFLNHIELLEKMDPYERSQVADALRSVSFAQGEYVIREGEWGEVFYIVEEGQAVATKTMTPGQPPVEVKQYREGEYFGELALLKGEPRAANIIARSVLKCVTLDRLSFRRMLGPLEGILRRNAAKYSGILAA